MDETIRLAFEILATKSRAVRLKNRTRVTPERLLRHVTRRQVRRMLLIDGRPCSKANNWNNIDGRTITGK